MPIRIALVGGPRCGKTTLIKQLYVDMKIKDLNVGMATEYCTEYLAEKGMIESLSENYGIYLGQLLLENSLECYDYALTDYTTFLPYVYCRHMMGAKKRTKKDIGILKDLYNFAINDLPKYNHIFFLPREFGYTKDGVRWQDEEQAIAIDDAIKHFLDGENIPYTVITGTTKERAGRILDIVGIDNKQED